MKHVTNPDGTLAYPSLAALKREREGVPDVLPDGDGYLVASDLLSAEELDAAALEAPARGLLSPRLAEFQYLTHDERRDVERAWREKGRREP